MRASACAHNVVVTGVNSKSIKMHSLHSHPFHPQNAGRPEPSVAWYNGTQLVQTAGGVPMGRHVIVNRLEVPQVHRDAFNTTFRCQAANTKLVPPAERTVRLDMLRECPIISSYRRGQDGDCGRVRCASHARECCQRPAMAECAAG